MDFSEWIIINRKRQGLTQAQLAAKLKVSRQTLNYWECGSTPIKLSIEQIQTLLQALNQSFYDIPSFI